MLWLVGSLFLTSMFWPAMTASTCGLYMQPDWSRATELVGTCHGLSGTPDFTHTKTFRNVPLPLTTTSSDFWAVGCARMQTGLADISMLAILGASPVKATLPVTVAPLASSGVAAPPPPAAGAALSGAFAVSVFSLPPQPAKVSTHAKPTPIQIFFML